ncbi:MAG: hypothetical protein J6R42_06210 [Clostridia bacterium]|nr:hypothetical protein [Clostridia bacterium]
MFQLTKIEYGRDNIPEPMLMPATAGTAYKTGMALKLNTTTHKLIPATGDTTATYIALEDKVGVEGEMVLCYAITPQMIFEVPLSAYSATTVVIGGRLQFATDAQSLTSAAASTYTATTTSGTTTITSCLGGMIIDLLGAKAEGDKVLVRLA